MFYSLCRPENRDLIAIQMSALAPGKIRIPEVETDCEEAGRGYFVLSTERQDITENPPEFMTIDDNNCRILILENKNGNHTLWVDYGK